MSLTFPNRKPQYGRSGANASVSVGHDGIPDFVHRSLPMR